MVPVGVASNLGLGVNYRPEVVSDGDPASEVTVFASHRLVNDWLLSGHLLTGLADGSPDWGIGFRIKVPF